MSRFTRQESIVPPHAISAQRILLVGAGAVGRNVGLSLAAAGAKNVRVIDFDSVELVNIATQGWSSRSIGQPKAEVLVESMKLMDAEGDADFSVSVDFWKPQTAKDYNPTVIFSCVDSMAARSSIYRFFKKGSADLLLDGRMLGEVLRFLAVEKGDTYYEGTLFKDEEAEPGRCTQQSTYYAANVLANMMFGQFSMYLRKLPTVRDRIFNLKELDLITPKVK